MKNIQKSIQRYLNQVVQEKKERGLQVSAYFEGELVLDCFAGYADLDHKKPVKNETLFPIFSAGKGIAATVIHILADQGKLDYDKPVVEYWPEFGVNGKKKISVRQILNHSAGLQNMPVGLNSQDLGNWGKMVREIQKLKPSYKPGSKHEYHAITFSWLVGELAQRIDGRSFTKIMEDTVCRPLKIKDMCIGIPKGLEARIAILDEPNADPNMLKNKEPHPIPPWICPLHAWMNTSAARHVCLPSSNGIMSAHAIARHYAALVPGGVDGVELLPIKKIKQATQKQILNDGSYYHRGLGYSLGGEKNSIYGSRITAFGHGGYGGSIGFADPKYRFAFALTKNHFSKNGITYEVVQKVRQLLGIPE